MSPPSVGEPENKHDRQTHIFGIVDIFVLQVHCSLSLLLPGIRNSLLSTEDHICPSCGDTGVSPDHLVPNKFLRTAVRNFMNETGKYP